MQWMTCIDAAALGISPQGVAIADPQCLQPSAQPLASDRLGQTMSMIACSVDIWLIRHLCQA
jgi:hypothetical protein